MQIITHKCPMVLNFSGGKDSTALALWALDTPHTFRIDSVLLYDMGMDFPEIVENQQHIKERFEKRGIPFYTIPLTNWASKIKGSPFMGTCAEAFEWLLAKAPQKKPLQGYDGVTYETGFGWSTRVRRWCTACKSVDIKEFLDNQYGKNNYVNVIGLAADELGRIRAGEKRKCNAIYPLEKAGLTERDCLMMCYDHGIKYRGLYDHIDRASCWCCPLGTVKQHRYLHNERPELWAELERLASHQPGRYYDHHDTVGQMARRFEIELEHPDWSRYKVCKEVRREIAEEGLV